MIGVENILNGWVKKDGVHVNLQSNATALTLGFPVVFIFDPGLSRFHLAKIAYSI